MSAFHADPATLPESIRARLRALVRAGYYDLADCGQLAHHHRARPAEVAALITQAEKEAACS